MEHGTYNKRYAVRIVAGGPIIDTFDTIADAMETIEEYTREDVANGYELPREDNMGWRDYEIFDTAEEAIIDRLDAEQEGRNDEDY